MRSLRCCGRAEGWAPADTDIRGLASETPVRGGPRSRTLIAEENIITLRAPSASLSFLEAMKKSPRVVWGTRWLRETASALL